MQNMEHQQFENNIKNSQCASYIVMLISIFNELTPDISLSQNGRKHPLSFRHRCCPHTLII